MNQRWQKYLVAYSYALLFRRSLPMCSECASACVHVYIWRVLPTCIICVNNAGKCKCLSTTGMMYEYRKHRHGTEISKRLANVPYKCTHMWVLTQHTVGLVSYTHSSRKRCSRSSLEVALLSDTGSKQLQQMAAFTFYKHGCCSNTVLGAMQS